MLPYQIRLPEKDFFISVEWLRIASNEYRSSLKYQGKDTEELFYNPCICYTKEAVSGPLEIWNLAYSGQWHPEFLKEEPYSMAISATVKY
jgi:hypothetical protein